MADKHLKREPQRTKAKDWWWYEEPRGIMVVHDGLVMLIPWSILRNALARKDRKP